VDDRAQNAILQRIDKKDYANAFTLMPQKCRSIIEGLLELKCSSVFETTEKIIKYVEGYSEAAASAENLLATLKLVTESGCEIAKIEPAFARGLEYYTGMIFEVYIPELEIALGGGGRYDRLIEAFGGEATPATGVAHGLDRIAIALQTQKVAPENRQERRVAVIPVKDEVKGEALRIAQMLRLTGIPVEFEVMGRKMAKALEDADKRRLDYVVIVGEKELQKNAVVLKDLAKHEQNMVAISSLVEKIKS